jgi:hypothetical protein
MILSSAAKWRKVRGAISSMAPRGFRIHPLIAIHFPRWHRGKLASGGKSGNDCHAVPAHLAIARFGAASAGWVLD